MNADNNAGAGNPFQSSQPPQSPFQAAPLFVRDRYGSADSTSTLDEKEGADSLDEAVKNPWGGNEVIEEHLKTEQEKSKSTGTLPPVDGGIKAWSVIGVAFLLEGLLWSFPLSFGVFQNHYFTNEGPFKGNKHLPVVGVLATGILFLGAPLMTILTEKFPKYRRQMIWLGWPICVFSLLAGSFARNMPSLIATQGIMYSIGHLILYLPLMGIINEWFIERRGLAYGIVTCSTGITGIALPFIAEVLLTKYGYETTLRVFCVILTVTTGPLLYFLKPRLPDDLLPNVGEIDWSFLKKPLFWIYSASNLLQSCGFIIPSLFLPHHATSIGLTPTLGALLLALISLTQIFGQLLFGFLSDKRIPLNILIFSSSFLSAIAVLTLWGMGSSLVFLAVFSGLYGFFASGYVVLWARMGTKLSENPASVLATFGIFSFQKGVGNIISGPISSALLGDAVQIGTYGVGRFMGIIIFTGVTMFVSAVIVGTWYVLPRRFRAKPADVPQDVVEVKMG